MPTYTVTDPNTGRKVRLTGESPPTEAELEQIFSTLGAAQPAPAVQPAPAPAQPAPSFIGALTGQQGAISDPAAVAMGAPSQAELAEREAALAAMSPAQRQLVEETGPLKAGLIAAGKGLTTIGRATGLVEPATEFEKQAYQQLEEQYPVATTTGEIVGEAAPFVPLGVGAGLIRQTAPRVAAMAGVGGLETGAIARGEGANVGESLQAAGIGATVAGSLELGLPVIGRIGGKIIRRVLGRPPTGAVVDAAGRPSQEFMEALAESGQTMDDIINQTKQELQRKAVDPKQAARKAFLESQGLDPTQAQISRTADDFMSQQEAAKVSGRVREALEKQDAHLTTRFNNRVLETGGDATRQSASVVDAITDRATALDQEISDLYSAVRQNMPTTKNIRFESLTKKLRDLYKSDRASGGRIKAVIGEMQAKGILDKKGKLVGRINVDDAEDLRKFMNELYDEKNTFGNTILRKLKDSLDDDVFNAAGKDYFQQARSAKANFEKELSRSKISKFDKRKSNLVRDVLENKVNPDKLADDIIFKAKWRGEDLQQLKDYLHLDDAGKEAWNDLRADVMDKIRERSFIGAAGEIETQRLSADKLRKAINSIGAKKLNLLFDGGERKFLKDMLEVSKLREPVPGTAIGRGPSAQAIARIERKLKDIPWLGQLFEIADIEGRRVLRAKPAKLPAPPVALPPGVGAAPPIAAAVTAPEQEQQ